MPISRVGLGGALGGLGEGLMQYGLQGLKRRDLDEAQAKEHAWELQKMQLQGQAQQAAEQRKNEETAINEIITKMAGDPLHSDLAVEMGVNDPRLRNVDPRLIRGLRLSDPTKASFISQNIAKVDNPINLPNVSQAASSAGIDTTQLPPTDPTGAPVDVRPAGAPDPGLVQRLQSDETPGLPGGMPPPSGPPQIASAETLLPQLKAQFPHNNPVIEGLQQDVTQRGTALQQGKEDALVQAGKLEHAKTYNQEAAKQEVGLENFDTNLSNQVTTQNALTAGLVDRAAQEERAKLKEQWTPTMIANHLEQKRQEANVQLLATARGAQVKDVNEMVNTVIKVLPQWEKLKRVSARVNTTNGIEALAGRPKKYIGGELQLNNDVAEVLKYLAHEIALATANSLGGNRGQTSENDYKAMEALMMQPGDTQDLAGRKLLNFDTLLKDVPEAMAQMDLEQPPSVRIAAGIKYFNNLQSDGVATDAKTTPPPKTGNTGTGGDQRFDSKGNPLP